ncbi:uncharacterized protein LOC114828395 [Galendromus occidentalis]|uniref:Uncharacterized protein LOC114828395 n=1 Tax=Galendromus occidentalis TaxID=34638 RepID=A0AAJ7SHW7_9ACAR|nr:uncharacterized protein LOC114828395 [Galendromus occidentalis]
MHFLDLPESVLLGIAANLDIDALIRLEELHPRFCREIMGKPRFVTEKNLTSFHLEYLETTGEYVRLIDLENYDMDEDCPEKGSYLVELTMKCPLTTHLNMVRTGPYFERFLELLYPLEHLTTLCISMKVLSFRFYPTEQHRRPFRNLEQLFIEAEPESVAFDLLLDLINSCMNLKKCHVNVTDKVFRDCIPDDLLPYENHPLRMSKVELWGMVDIFVLTCYVPSFDPACIALTRALFGSVPSGMEERIKWTRGCIVYQRKGTEELTLPLNEHWDVKTTKRMFSKSASVVIFFVNFLVNPAACTRPILTDLDVLRRYDGSGVTLAMTWFPGRCFKPTDRVDYAPPCKIDALRAFWTIKEVKGPLKNCGRFGNERVPWDLKERLTEIWPSFHSEPSEYENFWLKEFDKDGSCFRRQNHPLFGSVWKFFSASLYLALQRDVFQVLALRGILPSKGAYSTKLIAETLEEYHTGRVRLLCGNKPDFLMDVEFCFDDYLRPRNCSRLPFMETCGEYVFYPPPPSVPRKVHIVLGETRKNHSAP